MTENNSLDIIDSLESNITKLPTIRGRHITKLPNMERFVNVKSLSIHDTEITELENLPPNLKALFCNNNKIKRIYNLPNSVRTIFCMDNEITEIINLPENIVNLFCQYNRISYLCLLPPTLRSLNCESNCLNKISNLPEDLDTLMCRNNEISYISILPKGLTFLRCDNTNLVFENIDSWKIVDNVRRTYLRKRLNWRKFFYQFIRRRKLEIHQELIYSPIFQRYIELVDPVTREFFHLN